MSSIPQHCTIPRQRMQPTHCFKSDLTFHTTHLVFAASSSFTYVIKNSCLTRCLKIIHLLIDHIRSSYILAINYVTQSNYVQTSSHQVSLLSLLFTYLTTFQFLSQACLWFKCKRGISIHNFASIKTLIHFFHLQNSYN